MNFIAQPREALKTQHTLCYVLLRAYLGYSLKPMSKNYQYLFYCNIVRKNISCDMGLKVREMM